MNRLLRSVPVLLVFSAGPAVQAQEEVCPGYNWTRLYRVPAGGFPDSIGGAMDATLDGGAVMTGIRSVAGIPGDAVFVLRADARGDILWQRAYGGDAIAFPHPVRQMADGGFVAGGPLAVREPPLGEVAWLLRLDPLGDPVWQRLFAAGSVQWLAGLDPTADGGVVFTGGVIREQVQPADLWVVKVDAAGRIEWEKRYGGDAADDGIAIRQTTDGGYVVAGGTRSFGAGSSDVWVLRLDPDGDVLWQRSYGSPGQDAIADLLVLDDGGFLLGGVNGAAGASAWIARLDGNGGIVWEATYGGEGRTTLQALAVAAAGGFVFAGDMTDALALSSDRFAARIDASGGLLWQQAYGTEPPYQDGAYGLAPSRGGGYFVSGASAWSEGFELVDSAATLLKLDAGGLIAGGCDFIRTTNRVATAVVSLVSETAAMAADTAASVIEAPFTPVTIQSRVSEPCFGLLPPQEVSGPGAVRPLVLVDDATLAWEPAVASGACTFNLYRGSIADLHAGSHGACLESGLTAGTATDAATPPPGHGFAYLVTGRNVAGEGTAGMDSAGLPRGGLAACP